MGVLDRIFRPTLVRARRAASEGRTEEAMRLFVASGALEEAESTALLAVDRRTGVEERVAILRVALRLLPEVDGAGRAVARELGRTLIALTEEDWRSSAERRLLLLEAARGFERAGLPVQAADAYLAGMDRDSAARVLEASGEVERLEALLGRTSEEEARARARRAAIVEHDDAVATGARREALQALGRALSMGDRDEALERVRVDLERRAVRSGRVRLSVDGRAIVIVSGALVVLGREGDVPLRGASLSRRHAELERMATGVRVRDLGSRNGTRVAGLPIAGSVELAGPSRISLGDDVSLEVAPSEKGLVLEVVEGPDRGLRIEAVSTEVALAGTSATLVFVDGWAVLRPGPAGLLLSNRALHAPVELLVGDVLDVEGRRIEVVG